MTPPRPTPEGARDHCPTCNAPAVQPKVYRCQRCGLASTYCKCATPIPTWKYLGAARVAPEGGAPEGPWKVRGVDVRGMLDTPVPNRFFVQRGDDQDDIVTDGSRDFVRRENAQEVCDALNRLAAQAAQEEEPKL